MISPCGAMTETCILCILLQVGVIDFSIYLKSEEDDHTREGRNVHITAILDQKNYVEELNRQLK
ncbi:hypothetical protein GDO81_026125 [Engystomops pustulosus]|uniref:Uncharacterized protein n=1 Tax=Engystomops pustulosus TaxID=76066 RepID=A0AAV6YR89_ENGPU|nr:hypothetical protein GDO81_026125 [Engystomops pustulosus]